ncbi:MAG: DASS family sodium-coupled anion symporter [Bacteroidota bacterium]
MQQIQFQKAGLLAGPILFCLIYFFPPILISEQADPVIALAGWMIIWWISEAISIAVTALLPLTLFPLLGLMEVKAVASHYASPIVYLFFGGFVIALALEKVQLHRRLALSILKLTGSRANGIIRGFMIATALMSMWISNTASTVVMLPIAVSVIGLLQNGQSGSTLGEHRFSLGIMLGIAFAANIGGMATLIGTPPNSVMYAFVENTYQIDIGFFQWMVFGVPFAAALLLICYLIIVKVVYPNHLGQLPTSSDIISTELQKLGPMRKEEKTVLVIFAVTALSWMLRGQINRLFPGLGMTDTSISLLAALAMFVVPTNWADKQFPLTWDDTQKLPWGILILFGGGLALAAGLSQAGLIDLVGDWISNQTNWPILLIASVLIFLMLFMTELIGNVALVTILIPLVAGIAIGLDVPILHLVIPVTLASSCAFMLPMATPPNAIVFASGHIRVYQMVRVGIFLNLISAGLLIVLGQLVVPLLF